MNNIALPILILILITGCATVPNPIIQNQRNQKIEEHFQKGEIKKFIPGIKGAALPYMEALRQKIDLINNGKFIIAQERSTINIFLKKEEIFDFYGLTVNGYEYISKLSKTLNEYPSSMIFITPAKRKEMNSANKEAIIVKEALMHRGIYPLRIIAIIRETYNPAPIIKKEDLTITLLPIGGIT